MSEDHASEHGAGTSNGEVVGQVIASSAAPDNGFSSGEGAAEGDGYYPVPTSKSEENDIVPVPGFTDGEVNGFPTDAQHAYEVNDVGQENADGGVGIKQNTFVEANSSIDEEFGERSKYPEVVDGGMDNGGFGSMSNTMEAQEKDERASEPEDAGKDEMFVDASDQPIVVGGRASDPDEPIVVIEAHRDEEKDLDHPQSSQLTDRDLSVPQLMDELAVVRSELERTLSDKEAMANEHKAYKEEREMFIKELSSLRTQFLALDSHKALLGENDERFVDRLSRAEMDDMQVTASTSEPLQTIFGDCLKFISLMKMMLDEKTQTESTMRELHAVLFMKDQEIEELHSKVTEMSVTHDVLASYMGSVQEQLGIAQGDLRQEQVSGKLAASEYKRKELDLTERLHKLGQENSKLRDDLDITTEKLNAADTESSKTKLELEQAESKLASAREKLSMAVTKGKALVQQRDSLRQSVNEKTEELEKCLLNLQQKTEALDASEAKVKELVGSQNLVVSLEESLSKSNSILLEIENIVSQIDSSEEIVSMETVDKVRWLVNQKVISEGILLENQKTRNALFLVGLPETVSSSELDIQVEWLGKSLAQAKDDLTKLLDKVSESQETIASCESQLSVAWKEVEGLTTSLREEKQEKKLFQKRLEDLTQMYEELTEKSSQVSLEKDGLMRKLLEISGSLLGDEGIGDSSAEIKVLVEKCMTIIVQKNRMFEDMKWKYEQFLEKSILEKERLAKMLLDISGNTMDDHVSDGTVADTDMVIDKCLRSLSENTILLENIARKYEELIEKSNQVSAVKNELLRKLAEVAGNSTDDQDSAEDVFIEKCLEGIRGRICASGSPAWEGEQFQALQSLLFVRYQELALCEMILEEDFSERSEREKLSTELSTISVELVAIKGEKDSLKKDLERAEEKTSMLREKLSLAVKKGKGLMQDRDSLRLSINEKNTEIENLKKELGQQESSVTELKHQIKSLFIDLEQIPKLESDIAHSNGERDKYEQILKGISNMLQEFIDSIEGIVLPIHTAFEDPMEKVKCLANYVQELQVDRTSLEQELRKVEEEAKLLSGKLEECLSTISSQVDALSQAERSIFILGDERKDLEAAMSSTEQLLERAKADGLLLSSKLNDSHSAITSLEDELSQAMQEMGRAKDEAHLLTRKFEEANKTIRLLEDALSQAEKSIFVLNDEKEHLEAAKIHVAQSLEKEKADNIVQAGKLADACATVTSLENTLLEAESKVVMLINEKNEKDSEVLSLNAKLNACMEDWAGTHGRIAHQSSELTDELTNLHVLVKNEDVLSLLADRFKKNYEGLRKLGFLLQDVRQLFAEKGSEWLENHQITQNDPSVAKLFLVPQSEDSSEINTETCNGDSLGNVLSYVRKIVESVRLKNELLSSNLDGFSTYLDEHVAVLTVAAQEARNEIVCMFDVVDSLKLNIKNVETRCQDKENKVSALQNTAVVLFTAFTDANQQLQIAYDYISGPNSSAEQDYWDSGPAEADVEIVEQSEYVKAAEKLSRISRQIRSSSEEIMNAMNGLQDELREKKLAAENAMKDRDIGLDRISKLEGDLEALQISCIEMKLHLDSHRAQEEKLLEKEKELASLKETLAAKDRETGESLLSKSQLEMLHNRVSEIMVPPEISLFPGFADKIYYILDNFSKLQHQLKLWASEKEDLQFSLSAAQQEIEHLKREAANFTSISQDLGKKNNELAELTQGLERIIGEFGDDSYKDKKFSGVGGLLLLLEKLVMGLILEAENSKAKAQGLESKLHANQELVDDLSAKIKLFEDEQRERPADAETLQERNIYEAPLTGGSEILEIDDETPAGATKTIPSSVPAAQLRTMKKASSDHLAIDIDLESRRLINHHEADDDKGHVFKSLNSSGLIPKQGKLLADRVDGIWVSGGRILMGRPGARISLIAYWLLLHMWVLGTIL